MILMNFEARSVVDDHRLKDMTCLECEEKGHASMNFYKSPLYEEVSVNDGKLDSIFKQNYWYSVCQPAGGRNVTYSILISNSILTIWGTFRTLHSSASYAESLSKGASQLLTAACVELATIYRNKIVDNFESRLLRCIKYRLQNTFLNMRSKVVAYIAEKYCYQFICGGSPEWGNRGSLSEDLKEQIKDICLPLKGLLPVEVTLVTLSKQPRSFVSLLSYILSSYEVEQKYNPVFIGPGRSSVFTAACGLSIQKRAFMRCTTK
ncbi:hypothetical protein F4703DRAFT_1960396 [Phycomyces blakesleeanus]